MWPEYEAVKDWNHLRPRWNLWVSAALGHSVLLLPYSNNNINIPGCNRAEKGPLEPPSHWQQHIPPTWESSFSTSDQNVLCEALTHKQHSYTSSKTTTTKGQRHWPSVNQRGVSGSHSPAQLQISTVWSLQQVWQVHSNQRSNIKIGF